MPYASDTWVFRAPYIVIRTGSPAAITFWLSRPQQSVFSAHNQIHRDFTVTASSHLYKLFAIILNNLLCVVECEHSIIFRTEWCSSLWVIGLYSSWDVSTQAAWTLAYKCAKGTRQSFAISQCTPVAGKSQASKNHPNPLFSSLAS